MRASTIFILSVALLVLFSCNKEQPSNQYTGPVSACFSLLRDTVNVGDTVLFIGCSQNANTLLYDFGDGTTSALRSPVHVFTRGGTYSVSLRAANSFGSRTASATIVVNASIPSGSVWRFFAPGSSTDSMVFHGEGRGAFLLNGYDLLYGLTTVPGNITAANSFTFSNQNCCGTSISGTGSFSGNDSTVNMTIVTITYSLPPDSGTATYDTGSFYGVRR